MTVKISNLPAATSVGSGDVIPVVQSGTTKKIDLNSPWSINIDGGNIDGTPIGVSSASSGAFTALTASGDILAGIGSAPSDLVHGRTVVASSSTGGDFVAYRPTNVNVGDRCGAFVIGNNDADGAEPHYVGMWGKASSTNGSMDLHFAAGRSGYEGDAPQMTLVSGGNVGIGVTDPSSRAANADNLVIGGEANVGMTFSSNSNTGNGGIYFGDATSNTAGIFAYSHTDNAMQFFTNGVNERMRIDSSGRVGIGTTAPSSLLTVASNQSMELTGNNLIFNRDGLCYIDASQTNGILNLRARGVSGQLIFQTNDTERMRIDSSGHAIIPAGVTLGTSAGVYNAANTLDDYEEGTWTPASVTGSVSVTDATYTKVGRVVYLKAAIIDFTNDTSSNGIVVSGVPFTISGTDSMGVFGYSSNLNYSESAFWQLQDSNNTLQLRRNINSSAATDILHSDLASTSNIMYISIVYETS